MELSEHKPTPERTHDDVLSRIAVSASELAEAIHGGGAADVSEAIARLLDQRQAA